MIFNDTSTEQDDGGLVQDIDFILGTNSSSYPLKDKTNNINRAYEKAISVIIGADGNWEWHDTNYTDLPVATTDVVSGRKKYTYKTDYLTIISMELADSSGNWRRLLPLSRFDLSDDQALTDFMSQSGTPTHYNKIGKTLALYPTPNYNYTAGLKVYFHKVFQPFSTTDSTTSPGFASHLHRYLSLSASFDFALSRNLPKQTNLYSQVLEYELKIKKHYSTRELDANKVITPRKVIKR